MGATEKDVILKNKYGLHARPATLLAEVANGFPSVETPVEKAVAAAKKDLAVAHERYRGTLGPAVVEIFKFHQAMLGDRELIDEIRTKIKTSKFTAEYAVSRAFLNRLKLFRTHAQEMVRER